MQDLEGAPIIISQNSTLFISGGALFVCNRAIAYGGGLYAVSQSRVAFEETSNVSFIENSVASYGGAIYIMHSTLTMHVRVLCESNFAGLGGGAVMVANNNTQSYNNDDTPSISVIDCNGSNIIFRNNTSHGSGGAIYAMSQYSDSDITVKLKDVLFESRILQHWMGELLIHSIVSSI